MRFWRWRSRALGLSQAARDVAVRLPVRSFSLLPPRLRPRRYHLSVAAYLRNRELWRGLLTPLPLPEPLIYGPSPMELEISAYNSRMRELQQELLRVIEAKLVDFINTRYLEDKSNV